MSTLPHAEHALRKKAYAPHYVPAHINQFQPEIQEYSLELVEVCWSQSSLCNYFYSLQVLEDAGGKSAFECLALFRHLMVDIVSVTVYGTQVGALRKFSQGIEDPLTTAVEDFPTRGIVVSYIMSYFIG
jgi:cytochrome P450